MILMFTLGVMFGALLTVGLALTIAARKL